ncbi:CapA family protein [Tenacibaculum maritimum]|uniref:CapA family protein n=1 Tax=Tenacibaculum maritimum TaxID=107401 RepID=UPI0012E58E6E|nr:CapA family protein [Tenacibaculum maritimum]CAA0227660.1 Capsule biosynthesis protein CapA [Tenacibaculum maritimum]
MRHQIILLLIIITTKVFSQNNFQKDSISLIFMGDIMGHTPQIKAAFNANTGTYNYDNVFEKVAPIIKEADFAIANLEVTLSGAPYKGYPQFSSPDALAIACKNSGMDVLVTANNHSCDGGKKGILRTINVLDSLKIKHTGTFKNFSDKEKNNLLILNKNNIKVGLLNYTYGTNGLKVPKPTIVNQIDTLAMLADIQKSKVSALDKLIVLIHWGNEYQSHPSKKQLKIADFLFKNGVDIVIGGHPHVLQKMEHFKKDATNKKERFIAYSLGNFISNQRTRKRDGGAILKVTLTKKNNEVTITNPGYYLTWVDKTFTNGKLNYKIIPCATASENNFEDMETSHIKKMKLFMSDTKALFDKENTNVKEITIDKNNKLSNN